MTGSAGSSLKIQLRSGIQLLKLAAKLGKIWIVRIQFLQLMDHFSTVLSAARLQKQCTYKLPQTRQTNRPAFRQIRAAAVRSPRLSAILEQSSFKIFSIVFVLLLRYNSSAKVALHLDKLIAIDSHVGICFQSQ